MNTILNKKICFYFHGGGLIFGSPYDLPYHIKAFFDDHGYTIMPVHYPLAPRATFEEMVSASLSFIQTAITRYQPQTHIYFGRSAGAYLMFHVAAKLPADKLISFYGYMMLSKPFMDLKSDYYDSLPKVSRLAYNEILTKQDKYIAPSDPFYLLYVYLRQNSVWSNTISFDNKPITLNNETPIFLWHSLFDPDVPYIESKLISSKFTHSHLSTSLEKIHELDLINIDPIKKVLSKFLNKTLKRHS